jgi:hypothetical protein
MTMSDSEKMKQTLVKEAHLRVEAMLAVDSDSRGMSALTGIRLAVVKTVFGDDAVGELFIRLLGADGHDGFSGFQSIDTQVLAAATAVLRRIGHPEVADVVNTIVNDTLRGMLKEDAGTGAESV